MQSKGQLFSLDLIIAVALVILALGLLYRQAELFQYFQKDDTMQAELYRIGLNASNQLVSNPSIACPLSGSGPTLDYLPNCLPKNQSLLNKASKINLGIPGNFDCYISTVSHAIGQYTGCKNLPPSNAKNVFSIERQVVFMNGASSASISKKELDDCIKSTAAFPCTALEKDTLTLQVWKK
jgi:hypothetical protein